MDEWQLHQVKLYDKLYILQKNYTYLEPILNISAGQMGLQKETSLFKKAEKIWKAIMRRAKDQPKCKNWVDENSRKLFVQ